MTLKANIQVDIGSNLSGTATVGTNNHQISRSISQAFSDGAGMNQAEQVFAQTAQLAASAVDSIDLAGGVSNALGQALTFTKIKAIVVEAAVDNQGTISIGGNANALSSIFGDPADTLVLKPGSAFVLTGPDAAGYAVTATTADVLDITNDDGVNTADYTITVIGAIS